MPSLAKKNTSLKILVFQGNVMCLLTLVSVVSLRESFIILNFLLYGKCFIYFFSDGTLSCSAYICYVPYHYQKYRK